MLEVYYFYLLSSWICRCRLSTLVKTLNGFARDAAAAFDICMRDVKRRKRIANIGVL